MAGGAEGAPPVLRIERCRKRNASCACSRQASGPLRRQAANLIVAGEIFLLEVQGERRMMRVRMEWKDGRWYAVLYTGRGARRVELRDGLRAGFFDQRERYAKALGRD